MRETHFCHPYHRIGWWNGRFHQKGWLRDVGVALFLCEAADPYLRTLCPASASTAALPPGFDDDDPNGYRTGPVQLGDPDLDELADDLEGRRLDEDSSDTVRSADEEDLFSLLATITADPPEAEASTRQMADEGDQVEDNDGSRDPGKCPRRDPRGLPIMVIGDVTHLHTIGVQFCTCPTARPRDEQLLEYGIYPASADRPATGFTLHTLDYLRLNEVECKTKPDAYSRKLRRLTDSQDWRRVPVCIFFLHVGWVFSEANNRIVIPNFFVAIESTELVSPSSIIPLHTRCSSNGSIPDLGT